MFLLFFITLYDLNRIQGTMKQKFFHLLSLVIALMALTACLEKDSDFLLKYELGYAVNSESTKNAIEEYFNSHIEFDKPYSYSGSYSDALSAANEYFRRDVIDGLDDEEIAALLVNSTDIVTLGLKLNWGKKNSVMGPYASWRSKTQEYTISYKLSCTLTDASKEDAISKYIISTGVRLDEPRTQNCTKSEAITSAQELFKKETTETIKEEEMLKFLSVGDSVSLSMTLSWTEQEGDNKIDESMPIGTKTWIK